MPERDVEAGEVRPSAIDDLAHQVEALARRVGAIEDRLGLGANQPDPWAAMAPPPPAIPARTVPVVGHALLAIAGAYLLRALTEMGTLPLAAGVTAGILYAVGWLAFAARTPADRRLEVALRALTAVLVLAPLIWESTVRFRALPAAAAAAVLALFTILGLAVSWRKKVSAIAWIVTLAGVVTSWALLVGTRDAAPFAFALLAILAAVEVSACLEHWLPERWVAAAGADLGVLLLTYLSIRQAVPESYAPLPAAMAPAAQATLLGICLTSTIVRTLVRGFPFTRFEIVQCSTAFLIGVGGSFFSAGRAGLVSFAMPAFTLLCGAACYAVCYSLLERQGPRHHNFRTYAVFALLLTLAGSATLLAPGFLAVAWSAAGLLCSMAGGRWDRQTLRWHGLLYLLLAALTSGLAATAGALLAGSATGLRGITASGWTAVLAIALSYAAGTRGHGPGREYPLAISALLTGLAAGIAAGWLTGMLEGVSAPDTRSSYSATMRTAVLTIGSVALAAAGIRWRKRELTWLVYPMMVLCTFKLVAQDLRVSRTMALFLSMLLFGGSLTVIPRVLQKVRPR